MKKWNISRVFVCILLAALTLALPVAASKNWTGTANALTRSHVAEESPLESDAASDEENVAQAELTQTLPGAAESELVLPEPEPVPSVPAAKPIELATQVVGSHEKYMDGDTKGMFQPSRALTRAELAQILYGVIASRPDTSPTFYDVAETTWYAPAVKTVTGLGLMSGSKGAFRPNAAATRAECAAALEMLLPSDAEGTKTFPDVPADHWAYAAIARTAAYGLFQGDTKGNFRPDAYLLRSEAVTVFNRLLGRVPDEAALARMTGLRYFPDVPTTHWAYAQVMEATVPHSCKENGAGGEEWTYATRESVALADGPYRINNRLYWVNNGSFVRSATLGDFTFDAEGRYTTGNAELDQKLNDIIASKTNDSMTRDEKLRALFNYVRDNFTYLKRPIIKKGQTGWEPDYAMFFLTNGKGNCFCFSATYSLLCHELGLPAKVVVGRVLNGDHGWVEIELDGTNYMFDTQLEWRYLHDWGITGYNLFKMLPTKTPFKYTRS